MSYTRLYMRIQAITLKGPIRAQHMPLQWQSVNTRCRSLASADLWQVLDGFKEQSLCFVLTQLQCMLQGTGCCGGLGKHSTLSGTVAQESKCICSPEEPSYRAVTLRVPTTEEGKHNMTSNLWPGTQMSLASCCLCMHHNPRSSSTVQSSSISIRLPER